jgi:hypothetical protein
VSVGNQYTLTVPAGDYIKFGLTTAITNNPAGLYAIGAGITDSNAASSAFYTTGTTAGSALTVAPTVNSIFTLGQFAGASDGAGGIGSTNAQALYGAVNVAGIAVPASTATLGSTVSPGTGPITGFSKLIIKASAGGTSVFTPVQDNAETGYILTAPNTTTPTKYHTQNFVVGTDTITAMPTLTIITTPSGGGSTTGSNKIISLSTTGLNGTAPNGYGTYPGPGVGTLTSYHGSLSAPITPVGAANVSGFVNLVGTANGYVLLELALNGQNLAAGNASIGTIVSDINTSNNVGAVAIPTSGSPLSQYAGSYDVAIPVGSASTFAYDFSNTASDFTDPDTTLGAVSVTAIAAVPEPATAAGVILGAAGLLLGRRKSRLISAR